MHDCDVMGIPIVCPICFVNVTERIERHILEGSNEKENTIFHSPTAAGPFNQLEKGTIHTRIMSAVPNFVQSVFNYLIFSFVRKFTNSFLFQN